MSQKNQPGYPLPEGELGDDEIVCQLIYLPNRDEYWQALFSAIHYMSSWVAWERDEDKRGKDAAANWREAFEQTVGCWRMTCLEELKADVAGILALLQSKKDCCDNNITYGPQTEVETDIQPEIGDPPEFYGETEIVDWDDWLEHVCYNAHEYVDMLILQADQFSDAVANSFIVLGLVAAVLAVMSFTVIGLPISYAVAAIALVGLLDAASGTFETTGDDIEDARHEIVCAFLQGSSVRNAIEDAIGASSPEWLLLYQFPDYESATAIVYEGGYEGEFLPTDKKDDCWDCDLEQLFPEDLYIETFYGQGLTWLPVVEKWAITSDSPASCDLTRLYFWVDDTKAERLAVRVKVFDCTGNDLPCGDSDHHYGNIFGSGPSDWEMNHPVFPTPDLSAVNVLSSQHDNAHNVVFRLYLI